MTDTAIGIDLFSDDETELGRAERIAQTDERRRKRTGKNHLANRLQPR